MRFATLGSGSRGNATLVATDETRLMVDCGFSLKQARQRLADKALLPEDLDAILVTHEHSDHCSGVVALALASGAEVWMTAGTHAALVAREKRSRGAGWKDLPRVRLLDTHGDFTLRDLHVEPFPVPHDAREPCQFVFDDGHHRLGTLTDAGHCTQVMRTALASCDALFLEFNHDREMLHGGGYPPALIERIDSDYGHLNNAQSAALLAGLPQGRLEVLIACHLSEQNNSVQAVRAAASDCGWVEPRLVIADQQQGCGWQQLGN